jgi:sugar O-acyltransferase (sialic acid O-acetyltransferase NeuD family)
MLNPKPHTILGIYGAGGFAREVMPVARECNIADNANIYFVETTPTVAIVNGINVLSEDDFLSFSCERRCFNVAIADSKARENIALRCINRGARPVSLKAANSVCYDNNMIDGGAILCAFTIITSNVTIGKFFHANCYSYVAHDCIIGDYVTFAPDVHCNGNVHIGSHAYIGTGAMIHNGTLAKPLTIGAGAIVGMGAVVTKDVPPHTTVIGNPARVMEKN